MQTHLIFSNILPTNMKSIIAHVIIAPNMLSWTKINNFNKGKKTYWRTIKRFGVLFLRVKRYNFLVNIEYRNLGGMVLKKISRSPCKDPQNNGDVKTLW